MTTTTMQIVPTGPIETFSDKPLTVNGVQIQPTWAWSKAYRKIVRAEMAHVSKCPKIMARQYRDWQIAQARQA